MENNKLLIGVQFTYADTRINPNTGVSEAIIKHHTLEVLVLQDITLQQLMDGIAYGLSKRASSDPLYEKCYSIFDTCVHSITEVNNRPCYSQIYLGFCYQDKAEKAVNDKGEKLIFEHKEQLHPFLDCCTFPLKQIGFINSSRLIFSTVGENEFKFRTKVYTSSVIPAFSSTRDASGDSEVGIGKKITFPEYNISTRLLYRFDDTPVEIIPPQEPPKKASQSLFTMLLPSLLTLLVMLVGRTLIMGAFNGNAASALQMALFSGLMSAIAVITTAITWSRQRKEYHSALSNWRVRYEDYINELMRTIRTRQKKDTEKLKELYPDTLDLIKSPSQGLLDTHQSVYSLNSNIYSRAPQDEDFLTFRVGLSNEVESRFPIKGEEKNVVFSEAYFTLTSVDRMSGEDDDDILRLYLGSEKIPKWSEAVNISRLSGVISKRFRYMDHAPLLFSLKNVGAIGVVDREADSPSRLPCAANYFITRMIVELCYYHSPENLQFVIFFPENHDPDDIERMIAPYTFMPHFRELFPDRSQFVFDDKSAGLILSGLLNLMIQRQSGSAEKTPHVVLIVYHEHSLRAHAFAEFLPKAPEPSKAYENQLGLTFVYVTNHREYLPHYCDDVFFFDRQYTGDADKQQDRMIVIPRKNVENRKNFEYPVWSKTRNQGTKTWFDFWGSINVASSLALQFLSTVYYTRIAENGNVPSVVSLFELLPYNGLSLEDTIRRNWGLQGDSRGADITKSLRVPIGKTDTDTAYLDLHEKGDGPHMLVAGTTGSGKTETIITYLLELCVQFRPDELNLLLVDMKGGGFTKRIGQLPHVVGAVTDVDGDENGTGAEYMLRRFLDAMRSEIKRRKLLFNNLHVDSIDDYINACRNINRYIDDKKDLTEEDVEVIRKTAEESPLSHIMLVVDEFTELKQFTSENDDLDFMGEITKIARIGRSLGFHILLISQNIEGAITDDIRVNSNARLCLKVATRQASREMIGTDVAFSPTMPGHGRAYLKVLTRENLTYFQSGYSAASVSQGEKIPFEIILASKYGSYEPFFASKEKDEADKEQNRKSGNGSGEEEKQLTAVVKAICAVHRAARNVETVSAEEYVYHDAHIVFHPPLPNRMVYRNGTIFDMSRKDGETPLVSDIQVDPLKLPMGLYDDPLNQKQPLFNLEFYRYNTAIFGVSNSGKTTLLKTFLFQIHATIRPDIEENVYILDFGGNLEKYRDLPYVCACFGSGSEEDIKRVFHVIEKRMEQNAEKLGSQNYVSRLSDSPRECPPHMTLIIENLNTFLSNERYASYQEQLLQFCRDGLSKGLSVMFTASDTAGTGRFMAMFQKKIAFEMPTESYYDIFGRKVAPPMRLPGRGIVTLESTEYEFQCFDALKMKTVSDREAEEEERIEQSRNAQRERNGSPTEDSRLKSFAKVLTAEDCEKGGIALLSGDKICVGLDYERHRPVYVDIQENRSIAIYGKRHFGKTNLLQILLDGILKIHPDARFVLLDGGKGQLTPLQLPAFYEACPNPRRFTNDLAKFWDYLYEAGYCSKGRGEAVKLTRDNLFSVPSTASSVAPAAVPRSTPEWKNESASAPLTVFILQCRKIYQNSPAAKYLMGSWLPEAISDADDKKYLFLFTDVKPVISDPDISSIFLNNISLAFLLDNIGEFVMDKGTKSVFGEMDAKELKSRYARCSLGDGYYYDMEDETKLKFIQYGAVSKPDAD